MDEVWERVVVAGGVIVATLVLARVVDRTIAARLELRPETMTRYRVIRRSAIATVLVVGILSALLVIPGVQAVAGTILASSAVIALVIGFAAQTTLSNFVAGLLIALALGAALAAKVAHPVQQLAGAATALGAGDLAAPVPSSSIREVDQVGTAFREMRSALAARLAELRDANAALTDRNARLTALQTDLMQRDRLVAAGRGDRGDGRA